MNGVSPNGKYGGMRLCQISGAGSVSWKGLGLFRLAIVCGFVGEMIAPRPSSLGCGGRAGLRGDLLLGLGAVGAGAALALAGEAERTLLDGDGLFPEREAARLMGDFFGVFLVWGAGRGLVCRL